MSGIMENKQMLHIVTEIIVIGLLFFWVKRNNASLTREIGELNERLNEQELLLEKQDETIKQLISVINNMRKDIYNSQRPKEVERNNNNKSRVVTKVENLEKEDIPYTNSVIEEEEEDIPYTNSVVEEEEKEENDNMSLTSKELDQEIQNEIDELDE